MSKGRIILADEQELFRRAIRQLVESQDYEVVAEAGNGTWGPAPTCRLGCWP